MGQQREQLVMGVRLHQINNTALVKKYFIWGLGLAVPFLVLFCIFPSGTSLYRLPPTNRIVVSQLPVPSLRAQSTHDTLPSDEIYHRRKSEEKPSTSSIDEPDLASKQAKRRSDGLSSKKSVKQNDGMDSSTEKAKKKMNKEPDASTDKELDEQTNAEENQTKESSRKGKIKHDTAKVSDTGIDGKESRSGRKPEKEKEEISSLGMEISANEEDPISSRSTSSKKSTRKEMGKHFLKSGDSIAEYAEEGASSSGKGKPSKQRLRKEHFAESGKTGFNPSATEKEIGTNHAADLLFLENADKGVFLIEPSTKEKTKKRSERSVSGENIGEDEDLKAEESGEDDHTSHSNAKPLPFSTKQSEKCRYYKGRWIMDSRDPLHMDSTCSWMSINDQQNCKFINKSINATQWRWQPSDCSIERFEVKSFLELVQGKSLAFVGDKIAEAQMQSLICLLAQVEKPSLVYDNKNNKSMLWHFRSSNFTISMIWSPYLVQDVDENGYKKLHLDKLDTNWAVMVPTLDVLILGVGSLFIEPSIYLVRDEVVGCYACKDLNAQNNITKLSIYSAFRATIRSAIMGVGALPGFEGITLFLQPFGFEGNGSYHFVSMKMKDIQEDEIYQAQKRGSISNQSKMEVLPTNLISGSKNGPMQHPKNSTCLAHSPLANTWNQFLQQTLTYLLDHNSFT